MKTIDYNKNEIFKVRFKSFGSDKIYEKMFMITGIELINNNKTEITTQEVKLLNPNEFIKKNKRKQ